MQATGDLFDTPEFTQPIVRRRDPDTSKQAAAKYTATSRRTDRQAMLELIASHPGLTSGEYGNLLLERGVKPMKAIRMPTKRVSELVADGLVRIGKTKKCSVSGRNARTYYCNRST